MLVVICSSSIVRSFDITRLHAGNDQATIFKFTHISSFAGYLRMVNISVSLPGSSYANVNY
jgi:hypothetical protein